jgi:tol-pal system protein YbgF
MTGRAEVRTRRERGGPRGRAVAALLLLAAAGAPGCYTAQMTLLQSGLDSLRTQVDHMNVRDSVALRTLEDTRRELADQRDQLLATRATASSTARETGETLDRLEGKLDDIMARFRIVSERAAPARPSEPAPANPPGGTTPPPSTAPPGGAGPAPTQLYDQATQDLTQGRYAMALAAYRDFLRRFPDSDLADNAQYGAGECFFAQARFDSAMVEYARVGAAWGQGDRAPAALYKLGLCEDRLGRAADARRTFEDLVKRFPQSGEAQLARDRLARR